MWNLGRSYKRPKYCINATIIIPREMLRDLCHFFIKRQEAGLTKEEFHGGVMLELWEINAQNPPTLLDSQLTVQQEIVHNVERRWRKNCAPKKESESFAFVKWARTWLRRHTGCACKCRLNGDPLIIISSAVNQLWTMSRSFLWASQNLLFNVSF